MIRLLLITLADDRLFQPHVKQAALFANLKWLSAHFSFHFWLFRFRFIIILDLFVTILFPFLLTFLFPFSLTEPV